MFKTHDKLSVEIPEIKMRKIKTLYGEPTPPIWAITHSNIPILGRILHRTKGEQWQ
jgi:hypothetical protein